MHRRRARLGPASTSAQAVFGRDGACCPVRHRPVVVAVPPARCRGCVQLPPSTARAHHCSVPWKVRRSQSGARGAARRALSPTTSVALGWAHPGQWQFPDAGPHIHLRTRARRRRPAAAPGRTNRDDQALGARPAATPPGRPPGDGQIRVKCPASAARHLCRAHPHDHDRTLAATGVRDATRTRCRRTPVSGVFPALLLVGGNTESRPKRRSGSRHTVTTPTRQLLATRSGLVTAP